VSPGRVIVVTGASSGIGRALALAAAGAGFKVFAVARRGQRLAEIARTGDGGEIATATIDVAAPGAAKRIVAAALTRFGRIDVLVNNAGGVAVGPIVEQSDGALREQLDTHVLAPLALVREALPALRQSRGHVFFVGSGVARVPVAGLGAYPAAKAAIRMAARVARIDLRKDGVAVTYVDPSAVDTEFMRRKGMRGAPSALLIPPERVAHKILHAIERRPAVLNASPWQSPLLGLGEIFAGPTDWVLARFPHLVGSRPHDGPPLTEPEQSPAPETRGTPQAQGTTAGGSGGNEADARLTDALAPLANRMERLKLSRAFVAGLLQPGATLDVADVALRWAGMPNKNERALTQEVLGTLAAAGLLEPTAEGVYRVR
jgi:short-subunit dehydrogenase